MQHILRPLISLEKKFIYRLLHPIDGDLILEEGEIVIIIFPSAQA